MKIKIMVAIALLSFSGRSQTTIFSENMGNPSGFKAIASNIFQNAPPITFSGTADVRTTLASTSIEYSGASGNGNVFFTDTADTFFEISGIDTSNYYNLSLALGHYKNRIAANNELEIEVSSNGINYSPLSYSRATGSLSTGWILITPSGPIPSTTNLRIRFTQKTTVAGTNFRIDDVVLTGTLCLATTAPIIETVTQPNCATSTGSVEISGLPSTGTWTINPGNISGTGTSTTISGLTSGTYNFTVSMGCVSPASADTVIQPLLTNTWTAGSWSNGTPTADQNIVFDATFSSSANIEACSCIANADVTFNSGHTLTLTNGLTVTGFNNVIFKDGASLVQINNVANVGDINYYRTTTAIRNTDYTYWSSPVSKSLSFGDFTLGDLSNKSLFYYSFDSSSENWQKEYAGTIMTAGLGYIVRGPEPQGIPNPLFLAPYTAIFVGVPNNGPKSVSVNYPNDVSYLLGNPYPSAISAEKFLLTNAGGVNGVIKGTLYFWTHNTAIQDRANITDGTAGTGDYAYTSNDYVAYNLTGSVALDPGATTAASGYIAAGQGFFASSMATGNVTFDNSMRMISNVPINNSQFFKSKKPSSKLTAIERNRVWLNLTNTKGAFKQTLVGYLTDATNAIDNLYDGESYDGNDFIDFYSVNNDKKLTIQGRALPFDENDEVPLGYSSTIEGDFTIAIDQVDGSLTNQAVFIEDKLTNTTFNLKTGDYAFTTAVGAFNDRFVLLYTDKTLGTNNFNSSDNKVLVSCKNKEIKVKSFSETIEKLVVYDLLGRKIYQKDKVNSNESYVSNLNISHQAIIVKTTLQNGSTHTDKIMY